MLLPHLPTQPAAKEVVVVVVSRQLPVCGGFLFHSGVDNHEENGLQCLVSKFASLSHGSLWRNQ